MFMRKCCKFTTAILVRFYFENFFEKTVFLKRFHCNCKTEIMNLETANYFRLKKVFIIAGFERN